METCKLIVGTHALVQEAVSFRDLGLAVIDEQHRFGVTQRLLLGEKGARTDVLVMTATPIPRTLLLTQWGEMDVSRLADKPEGRQPVRTTLHSLATLPGVLEALARKLEDGAQIYWVCPMVAESEALDVAAAEARFAELRGLFGDAVGLAHGQLDPERREAALADFAAGRIRLLVATTVIEVGVDVATASVMVVEHAERFGLAQLHQLRGRVGRGAEASFCLLLHEDGLNDTARQRLLLLRDTEDGFAIADADFRLRGGGDLLGTKQAGLPGFRLADPVAHEDLLRMAHADAALLLEKDPGLCGARGVAVRCLLRLFGQWEGMRTCWRVDGRAGLSGGVHMSAPVDAGVYIGASAVRLACTSGSTQRIRMYIAGNGRELSISFIPPLFWQESRIWRECARVRNSGFGERLVAAPTLW